MTHNGPRRIALALSMVSHSGRALSSAGAQCKQWQLLSRVCEQEEVPMHTGAMHQGVHLHAGGMEAGRPQRHPNERGEATKGEGREVRAKAVG